MDNYHVTKKDKKWNLTKEGSNRAVETYGTKQQAVADLPNAIGKRGGGSAKIHLETGAIQEERTYPRSKDPKKTKG